MHIPGSPPCASGDSFSLGQGWDESKRAVIWFLWTQRWKDRVEDISGKHPTSQVGPFLLLGGDCAPWQEASGTGSLPLFVSGMRMTVEGLGALLQPPLRPQLGEHRNPQLPVLERLPWKTSGNYSKSQGEVAGMRLQHLFSAPARLSADIQIPHELL